MARVGQHRSIFSSILSISIGTVDIRYAITEVKLMAKELKRTTGIEKVFNWIAEIKKYIKINNI